MESYDVKKIFAERLKTLRLERDLPQTKLAKDLDVSHGSINYYENAERTAGIDFICKTANYFNCSADFLLGLSAFKTATEKAQYLNTEKAFSENLNTLSDKEKGELIQHLNHVLVLKDKLKNHYWLDIKHIYNMLKYVGLIMDEINALVVRIENGEQNEGDAKSAFGIYVNSLLSTKRDRDNAYRQINSLFDELEKGHRDILNKVCTFDGVSLD